MRIDPRSLLRYRSFALFFTLVLLIALNACSSAPSETAALTPSPFETVVTPSAFPVETVEEDTPIPEEPTATSEPLAAIVNGEGILLEDYQVELTLYQEAVGTGLATSDMEIVINDLIDQVLLAQAAVAAGFVVDDTVIQSRIEGLGLSDQALSEWIEKNGYSEDGFIRAMKRSIASAWMRDRLIEEVPQTADQVHARQILLYNLEEAEAVYAQLQAGAVFETLAEEYDPVTKGELGWFPRGYLTVSTLDDVLFSLEPGEYSSIMETSLGFHIVQVLERDADHLLSASAQKVLQLQSLAEWLDVLRTQSEIILFVP